MNNETKTLVDSFILAGLNHDEIHLQLIDKGVTLHKTVLKSYCAKANSQLSTVDRVPLIDSISTYAVVVRAQNVLSQIVLHKLKLHTSNECELPVSEISSLNTLTTIVKNASGSSDYKLNYINK